MSRPLDRSIKQMMDDAIRSQKRRAVLDEVHHERRRQESKWGNEGWPHYEPGNIRRWKLRRGVATRAVDAKASEGNITWEDLLWKEFCEAMSETNWVARRAELIQVAAVIVAEIEDGDLNNTGD